jgi:hypothetical protein
VGEKAVDKNCLFGGFHVGLGRQRLQNCYYKYVRNKGNNEELKEV